MFIAEILMGILIIAKFEAMDYDCALNYGTNRTSKQCSISIYFFVYTVKPPYIEHLRDRE